MPRVRPFWLYVLELQELHSIDRALANRIADKLWPKFQSNLRNFYQQVSYSLIDADVQAAHMCKRRRNLAETALSSLEYVETEQIKIARLEDRLADLERELQATRPKSPAPLADDDWEPVYSPTSPYVDAEAQYDYPPQQLQQDRDSAKQDHIEYLTKKVEKLEWLECYTDQLKHIIHLREEKLQSLEEELPTKTAQIKTLREIQQSLTRKVSSLQSEVDRLIDHNADLQTTIENQQNQLQQLKDQPADHRQPTLCDHQPQDELLEQLQSWHEQTSAEAIRSRKLQIALVKENCALKRKMSQLQSQLDLQTPRDWPQN